MNFEIEYVIKSSISVLYERISTISGLSEWFADDVRVDIEGNYIFDWNGSIEKAKLISKKQNEYIKFQWIEEETIFEMLILVNPITHDVALIVKDIADDEDEKNYKIQNWDLQIQKLKKLLGTS
tara:strand:- start:115 stop:486 length:372 start_codon:yes stop_codon:yes gene_type:complete